VKVFSVHQIKPLTRDGLRETGFGRIVGITGQSLPALTFDPDWGSADRRRFPCRTAPGGHQGQSRMAIWIDKNER
jgi:hypothetical protein